MDAFSRPDYYPTPSSNVVQYREPYGFKGKRSILNADLVALIVDLSSPTDAVDYTVISDFFLVYRNFVSPVQLQELLVSRFYWCIDEIVSGRAEKMKRRKIGEIALVRTFVLLRHWILNYFVQDFLVDVNLRLKFIKFLNIYLQDLPKIVRCTILNLKKSWIHCTKRVWTNLHLGEPRSIGEDELWIFYEIKDFTELDELKKRDSQLSTYAIQGSSSPNFRNQSVLSLYKSSDVFHLPVPSPVDKRKRDNRTASMILFPQDTSNVKNVDPRVRATAGAKNLAPPHRSTLRGQTKRINRLSRITKVSTVMKDVEYPSTPGIDKVIPPTPAKKVEIILQLPDENKSGLPVKNPHAQNHSKGDVRRSVSWNKVTGINRTSNMMRNRTSRSASTGRASTNFRSSVMHHGAMSLLNKWRKNHAFSKHNEMDATSSSSPSKNDTLTDGNGKKEMDNFVKYVISISSLEDRNFAPREMENLVLTKFDLLSARTIEEVEYLVTLENNLIKELNDTVAHTSEIPSPVRRNTEDGQTRINDIMQFSAMDNLNLYQTVNSIANSVFSLSRSLTQRKQQQQQQQLQNLTSSPSFAALERRKVQSAVPFMNGASQSRFSISSQTLERDGTPRLDDTGPQRLVFHGTGVNDNGKNGFGTLSRSDSASSFSTPTKLRNSQSPRRNSPSKGQLPNLQEHHETSRDSNYNDGASTLSHVSYDSDLSSNFNNNLYTARRRSKKLSLIYPEESRSLKRKDAHSNLHEFTFEDENKLEKEETQSLESFVTTNTTNDQRIIYRDDDGDNYNANGSSISDVRSSPAHDNGDDMKDKHESEEGNKLKDIRRDRNEDVIRKGSNLEHPVRQEVEDGGDDETKDEFINKNQPITTVRKASGRVSLGKKRTRIYSNPRESMWSAAQRVGEDPDYIIKDKELREKEMELFEIEHNTSNRISTATSVDTAMLFSSAEDSPRRSRMLEPDHIRLSATPSIKSISSDNPDFGTDTFDTYGESIRQQDTSESVKNIPNLSPNNNLQQQESVDSSFNYSTTGSQNGLEPSSGGMGSKYLFAPENEGTDYASPDKNVEALRNKFFEEDDNGSHDNDSKMDSDSPSKDQKDQENLDHVNEEDNNNNNMERLLDTLDNTQKDTPKVSSPESRHTLDWNNISQDSEVDDPVNVALMKLEGTYKRGENGTKQNSVNKAPSRQSSSASILAREVSMLGISDVNGGPPDASDKRKSLLIETRRRTIMNIPYTPTEEKNHFDKPGNLTLQTKDLLKQYEIKDPNLLVNNCGQHIPFILMYDSLSIAQQMTLIEKELLGEVDWKDLLDVNLTYSGPTVTSWLQLLVQNESLSGIDLAIARFNLTVDWIISEIILTSDVRLKRNTIQRFIHVADHCRSFQNYNTLMEIVLALNSTIVQKCIEAWRLIEPGDLITWGELKKIPSLDRNYSYIRKLLNNIDPIKGCAPFIVVYLSDLCLNNEKRTWIKENQVVNYNKFETNVQIVKNFIQRVQWSKFYDFPVDHELLSKCVYLTALSHDEITQVISSQNKSK
ncbi:hypothetical protein ZYGR_0AK02220 [Zygosaccharomyces rouxii]|uniref:Guanine nucleotide exchange factor LTE1 n=1 Tax=Zygosaccharomyces rouxii TaxID=4956 RepID=A0A1Q3ADJ9_ZYGRO|nr:hypothetical protein ZYGR_0AK02220 [Zygosaccharomyces rouxii]